MVFSAGGDGIKQKRVSVWLSWRAGVAANNALVAWRCAKAAATPACACPAYRRHHNARLRTRACLAPLCLPASACVTASRMRLLAACAGSKSSDR